VVRQLAALNLRAARLPEPSRVPGRAANRTRNFTLMRKDVSCEHEAAAQPI
jgi:hypothetical protein